MDDNRIIRISFPGIFFVASFFAFDWIFGGEILTNLLSKKPDEIAAVTGVLALIVSTPVLGFVISSFIYILLFVCPRWRFIIPQDNNNRNEYINSLRILYIEDIPQDQDDRIITRAHQQVLRMKMQPEELGYISRRFTYYLAYINTIVAILFALIFALLAHNWKATYECDWIRLSALAFYLIYIIIAWYLAYQNLRESSQFEIDWIRFYLRERIRGERNNPN